MHHSDASSIVHGWDNYPPEVFPKLWGWIQEQLEAGSLELPQPAMREVHHVSPECAAWLVQVSAPTCPVNNAVVQRAAALKSALGIQNDQYHPRGVDENDLLIIACACEKPAKLISNEEKQPTLPSDKKRYKIPAACSLAGGTCISFLEYVKSASRSFG